MNSHLHTLYSILPHLAAIMFAHPWMSVSQLKLALAHPLDALTFANADDLQKIHAHYLSERLVLAFDVSGGNVNSG